MCAQGQKCLCILQDHFTWQNILTIRHRLLIYGITVLFSMLFSMHSGTKVTKTISWMTIYLALKYNISLKVIWQELCQKNGYFLMLSTLGKIFSRQHTEIFFLFFPARRIWHFMHIVSNLFSGKNISISHLLKILPRVLSVKTRLDMDQYTNFL